VLGAALHLAASQIRGVYLTPLQAVELHEYSFQSKCIVFQRRGFKLLCLRWSGSGWKREGCSLQPTNPGIIRCQGVVPVSYNDPADGPQSSACFNFRIELRLCGLYWISYVMNPVYISHSSNRSRKYFTSTDLYCAAKRLVSVEQFEYFENWKWLSQLNRRSWTQLAYVPVSWKRLSLPL
jgi:hypothetical protein